MWIERLLASRTTKAIELAATFAENRHRVLAQNLANIDTPDYATRRLDPQRFQDSLHEALQQARSTGGDRLDLRGNAQFSTDQRGRAHVRPEIEPAENVLFHDGTNARLESLMSDVNDNTLFYNLSMNLLRGRYKTMLSAIRGKAT